MEPLDQVYRRESPRLIAALTRIFGVHNLALAEDVTQDAFSRAMEVWADRGPPENPHAWLMTTAKNRALDVLRRERTARTYAPDLGWLLQNEWTLAPVIDEAFSPRAVKDDLLRMMFSCCDPRLPEAAQVMLVLHLLCGFSVDEVAGAFVSSHHAVEKRVVRAKKVLGSATLFDVTGRDGLLSRLPAVQRALYLMFSEGYHGASPKAAVRAGLCREAMRLTALLLADERTSTPATFALGALMSFDAARLPARIDPSGALIPLAKQDRGAWDYQLLQEGFQLLATAAQGPLLSEYHVEAAIASIHASAPCAKDTDWTTIVWLYDILLTIRPSPIVALNRAIAVSQVEGPARGLEELAEFAGRDRLAAYPFYLAALGELELELGRFEIARDHFRAAGAAARNPSERRFFLERLAACAAGKPVGASERPGRGEASEGTYL
jgi:RNA polymerase sigma-70 factor (ECF subfamily)